MRTIYKSETINRLPIAVLALVAVVLTFAITGCSKNFLKPTPLSFYTPQNSYNTAAGLQAGLQACAKDMINEFYGDGAPILTTLFFSDVAVSGNETGGTQNYNALITPSSSYINVRDCKIQYYWSGSYTIIKDANTVIYYIDAPQWDTATSPANLAQRNAILGSAYFFRAYAYYDLVNAFGDVPAIFQLYTTPKVNFYSTGRMVILQQLKTDLTFAAQWVSSTTDNGQVTKGAVLHLLTKVNLALGDFDDAIQSANTLINGGAYHLMTQPFGAATYPSAPPGDVTNNVIWDLHRPENKALAINTEGLMLLVDADNIPGDYGQMSELRNAVPAFSSGINTPDGYTGTVDAVEPQYNEVVDNGRGTGLVHPSWYSEHTIWGNDAGDLRGAPGNWMTMEDLVYFNPSLKGVSTYFGQPLQLYNSSGVLLCQDTIGRWFDWPAYKLYVYYPEASGDNQTGGCTDWYVFRLAETYLLRAEAYWWKGDLADAATDINTVRTRAGASPIGASGVSMGEILDERARELFYEEPRKMELTRIAYLFAQTGKAADNGKSYTVQNFSTDNYFYDRVMADNNFYNKGAETIHGDVYTISPYHVLWPVPESDIAANTGGHINQNQGYTGASSNVAPLTAIPTN